MPALLFEVPWHVTAVGETVYHEGDAYLTLTLRHARWNATIQAPVKLEGRTPHYDTPAH